MTELKCRNDDCIYNKCGYCFLDKIDLIHTDSGFDCEQKEEMLLDFKTLQLKKV